MVKHLKDNTDFNKTAVFCVKTFIYIVLFSTLCGTIYLLYDNCMILLNLNR